MQKLTQEKLKELLHYNPDTGVFTRRVKTSPCVKIGDVAGCGKKDSRQYINVQNKLYFAHRLAWLYMYGYFPEHGIDHIDRIPSHNWITNLREVSQSCNLRNTGNRKDNKSGIKGVSWYKPSKKWRASITINGKSINLGYSFTKLGVAKLRLKAEQENNWAGCDISSPAYMYVMKHQ